MRYQDNPQMQKDFQRKRYKDNHEIKTDYQKMTYQQNAETDKKYQKQRHQKNEKKSWQGWQFPATSKTRSPLYLHNMLSKSVST